MNVGQANDIWVGRWLWLMLYNFAMKPATLKIRIFPLDTSTSNRPSKHQPSHIVRLYHIWLRQCSSVQQHCYEQYLPNLPVAPLHTPPACAPQPTRQTAFATTVYKAEYSEFPAHSPGKEPWPCFWFGPLSCFLLRRWTVQDITSHLVRTLTDQIQSSMNPQAPMQLSEAANIPIALFKTFNFSSQIICFHRFFYPNWV